MLEVRILATSSFRYGKLVKVTLSGQKTKLIASERHRKNLPITSDYWFKKKPNLRLNTREQLMFSRC